MSDEPIDFEAKRKAKQGPPRTRHVDNGSYLTSCPDCGGTSFRLWMDGVVECVNCACVLIDIRVAGD
jgi:uncharacterized Zn finger protein (UPF0148 family)